MLSLIVFSFFCSFGLLFLCYKGAPYIGLTDKPNARKLHQGAVPLVGGIAITLTLVVTMTMFVVPLEHRTLFLVSITLLTILGALDDKFDLCFKNRLVAQTLLSLAMIYFAGLELTNIGNITGLWEVKLGVLSLPVTILAVIGAINAFNMVDGIDGLLGGLSVVTFAALAWLLSFNQHQELMVLCILLISSIVPYICMNLGLLGKKRKVFMGDAGSMMIGFAVIWILLSASQDTTQPLIRPVTALWLIALPLMDMAAIMIRRIRRGDSPFKPDREHLHHIFQRMGLSSNQTLIAICTLASALAAFGIYGEIAQLPDSLMFFSFLLCFSIYAWCLARIWKITKFVRAHLARRNSYKLQRR